MYQPRILSTYPALRRFVAQGFRHIPTRDAPQFGMICLENDRQRLFVEPETGNERVGANFHFGAGRNER